MSDAEKVNNFLEECGVFYLASEDGDQAKVRPLGLHFVYNDKVNHVSHGTGDVFASAFVGSIMNGKTPSCAAKIAGEFTKEAIAKTVGDETHTYGVKFEQVIPSIQELLKSC